MTTLSLPCTDTAALQQALRPDALASAVRRAGFSSLDRVDITRVHFSDKRPVVLHLALVQGGRPRRLLAEVVGDRAADHARAETVRLGKSRRAQIDRNAPSPVVADRQSGLVFRPPGLDARLPGLRLLTDPEAALGLWLQAMGDAEPPVSVALVAHRLGKRAVLRVRDKAGRCCFVRLGPAGNDGPGQRYDRHAQIAESLRDAPDIVLPRPLIFDPDLVASVYAALPGAPMPFKGVEGFSAMHATLKALDALQGADQRGLTSYGPEQEMETLSAWHRHVSLLCPRHRAALDRAHDRVTRDLSSMHVGQPGFCHRDFHEGQILIGTDNRAGILDFDTAVQADPMIDVGNLMAHIFLHGLRTGLMVRPFEQAAQMGASFDRPRADGRRALIWRRASVLRLACIYAVTSEPSGVVDALFAEAAA